MTLLFVLATVGAVGAQDGPDFSQPLDVDALVRLALERNLTIAQSRLVLEQAAGARTSSYANYLPTANLSLGYTRTFSRYDRQIFDPQTNQFIDANTSQIDDSYGISVRGGTNLIDLQAWYTIKQARKSLDAARSGLRDSRAEIALFVRQQYYILIRSRELARVALDAHELRGEQLRRAESLFELGSVARSDVLQAQVNLATAERERIVADNEVEVQTGRLAVLLAVPVNTPLQIEDPEPIVTLPEDLDEDRLIREAVEQRADLRQVVLNLEAARYSQSATEAQRYPSLGGSYFYSKQEEEFGEVIDEFDNNRQYGFSLGLTVPIFDGLQTKGAIQRATAERRRTERELEQKRLDIAMEVREALLDIRAAAEGIRSAREGVALAEESVRLQRALYESGGGTLLEWNNAQVELTRARVDLVDSEVNLRLAQATLENAIGHGGI